MQLHGPSLQPVACLLAFARKLRTAPRPCNCTALHCNVIARTMRFHVCRTIVPKAVQLHGPSLQHVGESNSEPSAQHTQGRAIARPFIATRMALRQRRPGLQPKAVQLHGPSLQHSRGRGAASFCSAQGRAIARPFIATGAAGQRRVRATVLRSPRPCNCTALHCNQQPASAPGWHSGPKVAQLHGPSLQQTAGCRAYVNERAQGRAIARPFIATDVCNSLMLFPPL